MESAWPSRTGKSPLDAVIDALPDGILIVDGNGNLLLANQQASGLLSGHSDARRLITIASECRGTTDITLGAGSSREVVLEVRCVEMEWHGQPAKLLCVRDHTRQVKARESLRRLAYYDDLTGLYNRRGLELVAEHVWSLAQREGRAITAFYVDVDGLKQINDSYGHQEGDRVIVETAEFLTHLFRDSDIKARIGGDEFVVLVPEDAEYNPERVLARLDAELRKANMRASRPWILSLSMGVGRHDSQRHFRLEELLVQADISMYGSKRDRSATGG